MNIRMYTPRDYEMLASWWKEQGEQAPIREDLPLDSTFILEADNLPLFSICAYMTNVKGLSYLENFVGNPSYKKDRKKYAEFIVNYACDFLRDKGYLRVVCLSNKHKLMNRYQELGMTKTADGISAFARTL
jgi:hypothetical protein